MSGHSMRFAVPMVASLLVAVIAVLLAQTNTPENLVTNGDFAGDLGNWNHTQDATCAASIVPADVGGYKRAARFAVNPAPGSVAWSIVLTQAIDASLAGDDRLQIRVWMRSPEGCKVTAYLEVAREPWTKSLGETVTLTPEWKEYQVEGKCLQDFQPGEANLGFHLGHGAGTIEIAGIRLFDLDAKPGPGGPRPTLDHPLALLPNGNFSQDLQGNWGTGDGTLLKVTTIDVTAGDYTKGVLLESSPRPGGQPWDVQFGQRCQGALRKGDVVQFRAWLRSHDKCQVAFIAEQAAAPNPKFIDQRVLPGTEWKEYRFIGRAPRSFAPGESQAKFFLGYGKGTVEVAGVRVENFGNAPDSAFSVTIDYWGGREHPDDWRGQALERIEKIRKGDLTITVLDAEGKPVPDAAVSVEQKRHYFRFGTAAPAGRFVDTQDSDNVRFQQEVVRLFNTVTFENDLKWAAQDWGQAEATAEKAADWLHARGIDVRGHCLLWGSFEHLPKAVRDLRGDALLEACKAHVIDYASKWRGKLYLWDVVNEAGSNTELWDSIGWDAFADSYRWAHEADPTVKLCYNDYAIAADNDSYRSQVRKRVQYLLDHGAPVTTLGDQCHLGVPLLPIPMALAAWDEWAKFGKDLEVTEYDLGCKDDKIHADYMRDFMTAVFSHPKMTAFIMWGFWEGSHWRAADGGAMFRRDWTRRPAVDVFEDLVFKQWWTKWRGKTDGKGTATLRAFYGQQEVTAEAGGRRVTATVQLLPGGVGTVELRLP